MGEIAVQCANKLVHHSRLVVLAVMMSGTSLSSSTANHSPKVQVGSGDVQQCRCDHSHQSQREGRDSELPGAEQLDRSNL